MKHSVFDYAGFYGPRILIAFTIIILLDQPKYLVVYLAFVYIGHQLNHIIKNWVKQPRPLNTRSIVGEKYGHGYGMPSNHAQSIFFSLTFLYLVKHCLLTLSFGLFLAALTVIQRFKYKGHTITQLCVGSGLGIGLAYCVYYVTHQYLNREMTENRISI